MPGWYSHLEVVWKTAKMLPAMTGAITLLGTEALSGPGTSLVSSPEVTQLSSGREAVRRSMQPPDALLLSGLQPGRFGQYVLARSSRACPGAF
jgi:hypothetical protein